MAKRIGVHRPYSSNLLSALFISPPGYTPLVQVGFIAPLYILYWTNG